jgi:hypothetical protein
MSPFLIKPERVSIIAQEIKVWQREQGERRASAQGVEGFGRHIGKPIRRIGKVSRGVRGFG